MNTENELQFSTAEDQWPMIEAIARDHGFALTIIKQHHTVMEWRMEVIPTLVDLCNFVNDLGAAGVQATAWMPKK